MPMPSSRGKQKQTTAKNANGTTQHPPRTMSSAAPKVNGTFISEKVSCVRWIPEQYAAPDAFLTGSWECPNNAIKVWRFTADADFAGNAGSGIGGGASTADDDERTGNGTHLVPKCTNKMPLTDGDLNAMEFIDAEHIAVASADGFASVLHLNRHSADDNLREQHRFQHLHRYGNSSGDPPATASNPAPCTALSPYEYSIATVGADGRLNILAVRTGTVQRTYAAADSCTLTAVSFVSDAEVFAGNRMGTVKMFDVRAAAETPAATMLIACDDERKANGVTALAYHPTQRHILLAGSEEGSITVWDLRNASCAASYLTAHETAITELAFHRTAPNRLFTAAEGGELFQWSHVSGGVGTARTLDGGDGGETDAANPWLSGERIKNKIHVNWDDDDGCISFHSSI